MFDGHNHPIKSETNAERQMKREKVAKELQAYYDKVHINNTITEDDYEIHIKNIKKTRIFSQRSSFFGRLVDGR